MGLEKQNIVEQFGQLLQLTAPHAKRCLDLDIGTQILLLFLRLFLFLRLSKRKCLGLFDLASFGQLWPLCDILFHGNFDAVILLLEPRVIRPVSRLEVGTVEGCAAIQPHYYPVAGDFGGCGAEPFYRVALGVVALLCQFGGVAALQHYPPVLQLDDQCIVDFDGYEFGGLELDDNVLDQYSEAGVVDVDVFDVQHEEDGNCVEPFFLGLGWFTGLQERHLLT